MKKYRKRILTALLLTAMLLIYGCGTATVPVTEKTAVTGLLQADFLDVGQGNAVLVSCNNEYMLIDGGNRDYSSYVVAYLKKYNIEALKYCVVSHYDADHLSGVVGALSALSCDTVLSPDYETDTKIYEAFQKVVTDSELQVLHPAVGDTFYLGDAEFTVVCPDSYDYSDDNNNSIGMKITFGNTSFLICGDAEEESEEAMLAGDATLLDADVYLASHHGSSFSSSDAFLNAVTPSAVVISAGLGNSYGHPSADAISRIRATGAALYRTDLQGEIIVVSDGTNISFNQDASVDYRCGDELEEDATVLSIPSQQSNDDMTEGEDIDNNSDTNYIVNKNTKKFHLPSCASVTSMSEENKLYYTGSRQDAIDAGYDPCKRCNP